MDVKFQNPKRVLALKDRDREALRRAASGGAFSVLARPILQDGGVVFGAHLSKGGVVAHCSIDSLEELPVLQGSAYVQSDIAGIYEELLTCVRSGRKTLFVGTPCQCAAILNYLQAKRAIENLSSCENLILCELICHGVPNSELFEAHQEWLSKRLKTDDGIHDFAFRTKRNGWGLYYYYYYYYRNTRKYEVCEPGDYDPYYSAFLKGLTYRESCYQCPFARRERIADFTIGDYWGIENEHEDFYDSRGVSVMLINNEKANGYFVNRAASSCDWIESSFDSAARQNHNLNAPTNRPEGRDLLLNQIKMRRAAGEMDLLFDKDLRPKKTVKRFVKRILPASAFNAIKRHVKNG